MRRGLVAVLAWSLATGAAVTLSWWGVHTVMAGTAYDPPRALPVTASGASAQDSAPPAPPTSRPPAPATSSADKPSATAAPTPSHTPGAGPASSTSGQVRGYDTDGGRAVFDLGTTGAALVSATPGTGWSMQVWKTQTWIRVEFARSTDRVSVFCDWHDGPPHVTVGTY
ncbi:hypothetical protein [Streptomyces sp. NPDC006739]|uniref:hypothetical protein n=1 Tax=Streptomyces sp. NPDC006739 TaxID=3364763 RepID=UPI0036C3BED0